jgi:ribosomal protein L40E
MNGSLEGNAAARFCFECDQYPCKQINRMDDRYRSNYEMSVKDNLKSVETMGVERFAEEQYEKYHCSKCGNLISIHNGKCFKCDKVTRLVEKRGKKY